MKVGIVGMGYVGQAVARACYGYEIVAVDRATSFGGNEALQLPPWRLVDEWKDRVNECDIAFVCVPTPTDDNGEVDTSAVEEVLGWLEVPLIVIRSTIPVAFGYKEIGGTAGGPMTVYRDWGDERKIIYQPEFIGESAFAPWREESDVSLVVAAGEKAQEVLDFWKPILGPDVAYIATDWRTAAEIKYAVNCHGAVKAAWWREFLSGCANPDEVRNAVLAIPWIDSYHTLPIGDGVGGKCFPKDLKAWVAARGGAIGTAALEYMKD